MNVDVGSTMFVLLVKTQLPDCTFVTTVQTNSRVVLFSNFLLCFSRIVILLYLFFFHWGFFCPSSIYYSINSDMNCSTKCLLLFF